MGVYAFLVVITILATKKYFVIVVPAIISVLVALSFLALPKSHAFVTKDGNYLIQSPTCPHCKKVKEYLKDKDIEFTKLNIDDVEARNFATFLNFKTIPILLIKDGSSVKIINGDKDIIEFFENKSKNISVEESIEVEDSVQIDSNANETDSSSLLYSDDGAEEGCGFISLTKLESDCTKE
jgi:glutaredoxin